LSSLIDRQKRELLVYQKKLPVNRFLSSLIDRQKRELLVYQKKLKKKIYSSYIKYIRQIVTMDQLINEYSFKKDFVLVNREKTIQRITNAGAAKIKIIEEKIYTLEHSVNHDYIAKIKRLSTIVNRTKKIYQQIINQLVLNSDTVSNIYDRKIQQYKQINFEIQQLHTQFNHALKNTLSFNEWCNHVEFIDAVVLWMTYRKNIEPTHHPRLVRQTHQLCLTCILKGVKHPASVSNYGDVVCHSCSQKTHCSMGINYVYKQIKKNPQELLVHIDSTLSSNNYFSGI
jgi:hypothetical protein